MASGEYVGLNDDRLHPLLLSHYPIPALRDSRPLFIRRYG